VVGWNWIRSGKLDDGRSLTMTISMRSLTVRLLFFVALLLGTQVSAQVQRSGAEEHLDPLAFREAMGREGVQLVDVRTPHEHRTGHIEGNRNIDWTSPNFEQDFNVLDPHSPVLLYCRSGGRSEQALEYLLQLGFKDVRHLQGGVLSWQRAGLPLTE